MSHVRLARVLGLAFLWALCAPHLTAWGQTTGEVVPPSSPAVRYRADRCTVTGGLMSCRDFSGQGPEAKSLAASTTPTLMSGRLGPRASIVFSDSDALQLESTRTLGARFTLVVIGEHLGSDVNAVRLGRTPTNVLGVASVATRGADELVYSSTPPTDRPQGAATLSVRNCDRTNAGMRGYEGAFVALAHSTSTRFLFEANSGASSSNAPAISWSTPLLATFGGASPTAGAGELVSIAEAIIYDRELSAPEITQLQAYVKAYYGLDRDCQVVPVSDACPAGSEAARACEEDGVCPPGCEPGRFPEGALCTKDQSCEGDLVCASGTCKRAHCESRVRDVNETGADCGGSCGACNGTTCSRECRAGEQVRPTPSAILSLTQGVFRRASDATYLRGEGMLERVKRDERRFVPVKGRRLLLLEGASRNLLLQSQALQQTSSWTQATSVTVGAEADLAPDGLMTAERLTAAGAITAPFQRLTVPAGDLTLSSWTRLAGVPAGEVTSMLVVPQVLGNTAPIRVDQGWLADTAWSRESVAFRTTAAGEASIAPVTTDGQSSGARGAVSVWGAQLESLPFASTYVPTDAQSVERAPDDLSFAAASVPEWVRSGRWYVEVAPEFASRAIGTGARRVLLSFGPNDELALVPRAFGTTPSAAVELKVGGQVVALREVPFEAGEILNISVALDAGELHVMSNGLSQGRITFTRGLRFPATASLRIGGRLGGGFEAFAAFSDLRQVSSELVACTVSAACSQVTCGNGKLDAGESCDPGLTARCGSDCKLTELQGPCATSSDCAFGQVCGIGQGDRFASSLDNVCVPGICPGPTVNRTCGDSDLGCGECVGFPSCPNAPCGQVTSDGMGGLCEQTCAPRQVGCQRDADCPTGYACGLGVGELFGAARGTNVCWPTGCTEQEKRLVSCGEVASLCGRCPPKPNRCGTRQCGTDQFGNVCGTCAAGNACDAEGVCRAPPTAAAPPPGVPAPGIANATRVGTVPGALSVSHTGAAVYRVPLTLPPGRAGLTPELALVYQSTSELSPIGHGWSLEGLSSITRCPRTLAQDARPANDPEGDLGGVRMNDSDRFCLDGKRLVAVLGVYGADGTEYRTEVDSFVRVIGRGGRTDTAGHYTGHSWFEVRTKSGRTMIYGRDLKARVLHRRSDSPINHFQFHDRHIAPESVQSGTTVVSWMVNVAWNLESVEDLSGNRIEYRYEDENKDNGSAYQNLPRSIVYGHAGSHVIRLVSPKTTRLNYGEGYRGGVTLPRATYPLERISIQLDGQEQYHYELRSVAVGQIRRLESITQCVDVPSPSVCIPPTTFEYGAAEKLKQVAVTSDRPGSLETGYRTLHAIVSDFDGDGRDDVLHDFIVKPPRESEGLSPTREYRLKLGRATPEGERYFRSSPVSYPDLQNRAAITPFDADARGGSELFLSRILDKSDQKSRSLGTFDPATLALTFSSIHPGVTYSESDELADVDGDGRIDVTLGAGGSWFRNTGAGFAAAGVEWRGDSDPNRAILKWNLVQEGTTLVHVGPDSIGATVAADYDGDGIRNVLAFGVRNPTDQRQTGPKEIFALDWTDGRAVQRKIGGTLGAQYLVSSVRVADVNADGLDDLVATGSGIEVYLSTGTGYARGVQVQKLEGAASKRSIFFDLDRDGFMDLLVPFELAESSGYYEVKLYPFPAEGQAFPVAVSALPLKVATNRPGKLTTFSYQSPVVGDFDGDGAQEILLRTVDPKTHDEEHPVFEIWEGPPDSAHRLVAVQDGFGKRSEITYDRTKHVPAQSCAYPHGCPAKLPFGPVARIRETAPAGLYRDPQNPALTTYEHERTFSYRGYRTDLRGRGPLGFDRRTITDLAKFDDGAMKVVAMTEEEYDLGAYDGTIPYRVGTPARVTRTAYPTPGSEVGSLVSRTDVRQKVERSASGRPFIVTERVDRFERAFNGSPTAETPLSFTTYVYDAHGNVKNETTTWDDGKLVANSFTYAPPSRFPGKELVGLPLTSTTRGTGGGSEKTSSMRYDYDARGRLNLVEQQLPTSPGFEWRVTTGYDDWGNPSTRTRTVRDGEPLTETNEFDEARHMHLIARRNSVHEKLGKEQVGIDPVSGALAWSRSIDGAWVSITRDVLGRIHRVRDATGGDTQYLYELGPSPLTAWAFRVTRRGTRASTSATGAGEPTTVTEYSALKQPMRVVETFWQKGASSLTSERELGYDSRGLLVSQGIPHLSGSPSLGASQFTYDGIGRPLTERSLLEARGDTPQLSVTTHEWFERENENWNPAWTAFSGARAHRMTDAVGAKSTNITNVRGSLIAAIDPRDTVTRFEREAYDHTRRVEVVGTGVATTFVLDALGRVQREVSPDRGQTDFTFDGLGRVLHENHNGEITEADYDAFGRMRVRTASGRGYQYDYDTRTGNLTDPTTADLRDVGKLVSSQVFSADSFTQSTNYEYRGPGAQLDGIVRTINADTYRTTWTLDTLGRPDVLHYARGPEGRPLTPEHALSVKYHYGAFGTLDRVERVRVGGTTAAEELWRLDALDVFGSVAESTTLGRITHRTEWGAFTGAAKGETVSSTLTGQAPVIDTFGYDTRGLLNFHSVTGLQSGVTENFPHDALGRIGTTPTGTGTPEFPYDARGNLLRTETEGTLSYSDPAHPHRVQSTGRGQIYEYDTQGHGRVEVRRGPNILGSRQRLTYTSFDLPSRVTNGPDAAPIQDVRFGYDADDIRIVKQVLGGDTTFYVGDAYRRIREIDGDERHVFTVPFPDGTFLEVRLENGAQSYHSLQTDHLGSVRAEYDHTGKKTGEHSYDRWGRTLVDTTKTPYGFTGHEHDSELGLINMRGRMYDPGIGRFLTPDPIVQAPDSSQDWNRYSYAFNSPKNFTDPSGYAESIPRIVLDPITITSTPGCCGPQPQPQEPPTTPPAAGGAEVPFQMPTGLGEGPITMQDEFTASVPTANSTGNGGSNLQAQSQPQLKPYRTSEELARGGAYDRGLHSAFESNDFDEEFARRTQEMWSTYVRESVIGVLPWAKVAKVLGSVLGAGAVAAITRTAASRSASAAWALPGVQSVVRGVLLGGASAAAGKGGTVAGVALQKHAARAGSWLAQYAQGGNAQKNAAAASKVIQDILLNGTSTVGNHKVFGDVVRVRFADGAGAWWKATGEFIGFLERYTPQ